VGLMAPALGIPYYRTQFSRIHPFFDRSPPKRGLGSGRCNYEITFLKMPSRSRPGIPSLLFKALGSFPSD
jgi:hypothetical protein